MAGSIMDADLPCGYFTGVFVSNVLEHLPTQEAVGAALARLREATAPGGIVAVIGPNFRCCPREYFDCADHMLALTHVAVAEHLHAVGFSVDTVIPRFLPYSFRSRFRHRPRSPAPPCPVVTGGQAVPRDRNQAALSAEDVQPHAQAHVIRHVPGELTTARASMPSWARCAGMNRLPSDQSPSVLASGCVFTTVIAGCSSLITSAPFSRARSRASRGIGASTGPNPSNPVHATGRPENVTTSPAGPGSARLKLTYRNDRIRRTR
jgi:hypothetical protein